MYRRPPSDTCQAASAPAPPIDRFRRSPEPMASPDSPTCPTCQAVLVLGANGYDTFWSCPNGHGAACTMTAAYGHVQEDEIQAIWQGSKDAAPGERPCPMCGSPMVDVSVGVDAGEPPPGDGAATVTASIAVCREDELF